MIKKTETATLLVLVGGENDVETQPPAELPSSSSKSIDDEVEEFINRTVVEAHALASRTDEPIEIIRSFIIGGAVLTAEYMKTPSRSDRQELRDVMQTMSLASGGLLEGSVTRLPRAIQFRRQKRIRTKRAARD